MLFAAPALTQVDEAPERRVDAEEVQALRDQAAGNSTLEEETLTDELRTTANQNLHPEIGRAMRRELLAKREAAVAEKEQLLRAALLVP